VVHIHKFNKIYSFEVPHGTPHFQQ